VQPIRDGFEESYVSKSGYTFGFFATQALVFRDMEYYFAGRTYVHRGADPGGAGFVERRTVASGEVHGTERCARFVVRGPNNARSI
jgi:hypothetical protein